MGERYNARAPYSVYSRHRFGTPLSRNYSEFESISPIEKAAPKISKLSAKNTSLFNKFCSFLSTCKFAILGLLTFGYYKRKNPTIRRPQFTPRSARKRNIIFRINDGFNTFVYVFLLYVFLCDCWLLSGFSKIRKRLLMHRKKLLLLLLLPYAFLLGHHFTPTSLTEDPRAPLLTPVPANTNVEDVPVSVNANLEEVNKGNSSQGETPGPIADLIDRVQKLEAQNPVEFERVLEALKEKHKEKFEQLEKFEKDYASLKLKLVSVSKLKERLNDVMAKLKEIEAQKPNISSMKYIEIKKDDGLSNKQFAEVNNILQNYMKIYDADKTGKVDYALESAGGRIITTKYSERHDFSTMSIKLLGLTLYYGGNSPRTVIQRNSMQPGTCWAFHGFPGILVIKLRCPIFVTGFTVEHAPKSILPLGNIRSAPKQFKVLGLKNENDENPVLFGEYEFQESDESLQYFQVENNEIDQPYEFVELEIESNHGQPEFTCIYRFRVHGETSDSLVAH